MKLTVKRIERIKKPGRHGDGQGLYLEITKSGVKSWLLRYERGGQERYMGLGPLHTIDLAEARARARRARQQLLDGLDPLAARQAEQAARKAAEEKQLSFVDAAQQHFDQHQQKWGNTKYRAQFLSTLQEYAYPIIGAVPVGNIDTAAVLRVLEQKVKAERGYPAGVFWHARPQTANRVRRRIEAVLDWAAVRGYRTGDNPARWKGHIGEVLPARGEVAPVVHHAALPYAEMPAFMAALRGRAGVAARALEFLALTAARSGEVIGARWDEIDFQSKTWIIPAPRMKMDREHRVALSVPAVELLKELNTEE